MVNNRGSVIWVTLLAVITQVKFTSTQNMTSSESSLAGRLLVTTTSAFLKNNYSSSATVTSEGTLAMTTETPAVTTFELYDDQNSPCLRAQLQIKIHISYEATTSAGKSTFSLLPPDAQVSGFCGNDTSQLKLSWREFTLWMTFVQHHDQLDIEKAEENLDIPLLGQPYWEVSFIRLSFDVDENTSSYKNILHAGVHSVITSENEGLLATPIHQVYGCKTPQNINLTSSNSYADYVTMTLSNAKIQPFSIDPTHEWGKVFECDVDKQKENEIKEKNLVPIVVAGCLAGIIVLVVIAYIISKRTNKIPYRVIE